MDSGLVVLFDANNTAYRANSVTELYSNRGDRTSAITGVLKITPAVMKKMENLLDMPVKRVVYAWDAGKSKRRLEAFPEYKAHRAVQSPEQEGFYKEFVVQADALHKFLPSIGVGSIRIQGWEGDDLVYGLCEAALEKGLKPVIISTDEDFHQLIETGAIVYNPIKKILFTQENYEKQMGITPENYLAFKILKGDTSDGIPGIQGIGEKTAKGLVSQYGSLKGILSAEEELKKSARTARIFTDEGKNILRRNLELIAFRGHVQLGPVWGDIKRTLMEKPCVDTKGTHEFLMYYGIASVISDFKNWLAPFKRIEGTAL